MLPFIREMLVLKGIPFKTNIFLINGSTPMEDTSPERVQITYKTPKITFLDQVDLVWKKSHQKILNFSKVVVLTPSRDFPAGFFNIVRGFKNNCYIYENIL